MESSFYWMLLNYIPGIGPKALKKIYTGCQRHKLSIQNFFFLDKDEMRDITLLEKSKIDLIKSHKNFHKKVLNEISVLKNKNIEIIPIDSTCYPQKLLRYVDYPPTVIYTYGNFNLLKKKTVGIFASRYLSWNSVAISEKIYSNIFKENRVTVVGTSKEIYEYVSYLAKTNNGNCIVVVNFGVFDYKLKNFSEEFRTFAKNINKRFDYEKNLVISFVNPGYGWSIYTEKVKNEIIFALSDTAFGLEIRENGIMYKNFIKNIDSEKEIFIAMFSGISDEKYKVHQQLIQKGGKKYFFDIKDTQNRRINWKDLKSKIPTGVN